MRMKTEGRSGKYPKGCPAKAARSIGLHGPKFPGPALSGEI